jgi:hypothetical protein
MGTMTTDLEFQNYVVLAIVQALVGAVRPEVVAITVSSSLERGCLDLFVLVTEATEQVREILDEVETDLDALLSGAVRIKSHLSVGTDWTGSDWPGRSERPVFARSAE